MGLATPFTAISSFSIHITLLESWLWSWGSRHCSPEQGLRDGCTEISLATFTKIIPPTLRASWNLTAPAVSQKKWELIQTQRGDRYLPPACFFLLLLLLPPFFPVAFSPSFALNPALHPVIWCPPQILLSEEAANSYWTSCTAHSPLQSRPSQTEEPPAACTVHLTPRSPASSHLCSFHMLVHACWQHRPVQGGSCTVALKRRKHLGLEKTCFLLHRLRISFSR